MIVSSLKIITSSILMQLLNKNIMITLDNPNESTMNMNMNPYQQRQLPSTITAMCTIFSSKSDIVEHYKSDWHQYNVKRREMA